MKRSLQKFQARLRLGRTSQPAIVHVPIEEDQLRAQAAQPRMSQPSIGSGGASSRPSRGAISTSDDPMAALDDITHIIQLFSTSMEMFLKTLGNADMGDEERKAALLDLLQSIREQTDRTADTTTIIWEEKVYTLLDSLENLCGLLNTGRDPSTSEHAIVKIDAESGGDQPMHAYNASINRALRERANRLLHLYTDKVTSYIRGDNLPVPAEGLADDPDHDDDDEDEDDYEDDEDDEDDYEDGDDYEEQAMVARGRGSGRRARKADLSVELDVDALNTSGGAESGGEDTWGESSKYGSGEGSRRKKRKGKASKRDKNRASDNWFDEVTLRQGLEHRLLHHPSSVDLILQKSKQWTRFGKEILSYMDRRAQMMADFHRRLAAHAQGCLEAIEQDAAFPCAHEVSEMLNTHINDSKRAQAHLTGNAHALHVSGLHSFRQQHERTRKSLKDQWHREQRKVAEAAAAAGKAENKYKQHSADWERALYARMKEEQSTYKLKLDKRSKEESDARTKLDDARNAYTSAVSEFNGARNDLMATKEAAINELLVSLFAGSQTLRETLLSHHTDQHQASVAACADNEYLVERLTCYRPAPDVVGFVDASTTASALLADEEPRTPSQSGRAEDSDQQLHGSGFHHNMREQDEIPTERAFVAHELPDDLHQYLATRREEDRCLGTPHVPDTQDGDEAGTCTPQRIMSALEVAQQPDMHAFVRLNIPSKCKHCKKACYFNSVACSKCNLTCHKRCTEKLEAPCPGSIQPVTNQGSQRAFTRHRKFSKSVFGTPLDSEESDTIDDVPVLVRRISETIERTAMDCEGLYRLSGVKSRVEGLCAAFEANPHAVAIDDEEPATIAAVMKLYLRQLPEPVIPHDLFDEFLTVAKWRVQHFHDDDAEKQAADMLRALVQRLPPVNYNTLAYVCAHLRRVSFHADENKMLPKNLGIVFGPTLLRAKAQTLESLMNTPLQSAAIEIIIKFCEHVFDKYFEDRPAQLPSAYESTLPYREAMHPAPASSHSRRMRQRANRFSISLLGESNSNTPTRSGSAAGASISDSHRLSRTSGRFSVSPLGRSNTTPTRSRQTVSVSPHAVGVCAVGESNGQSSPPSKLTGAPEAGHVFDGRTNEVLAKSEVHKRRAIPGTGRQRQQQEERQRGASASTPRQRAAAMSSSSSTGLPPGSKRHQLPQRLRIRSSPVTDGGASDGPTYRSQHDPSSHRQNSQGTLAIAAAAATATATGGGGGDSEGMVGQGLGTRSGGGAFTAIHRRDGDSDRGTRHDKPGRSVIVDVDAPSSSSSSRMRADPSLPPPVVPPPPPPESDTDANDGSVEAGSPRRGSDDRRVGGGRTDAAMGMRRSLRRGPAPGADGSDDEDAEDGYLQVAGAAEGNRHDGKRVRGLMSGGGVQSQDVDTRQSLTEMLESDAESTSEGRSHRISSFGEMPSVPPPPPPPPPEGGYTSDTPSSTFGDHDEEGADEDVDVTPTPARRYKPRMSRGDDDVDADETIVADDHGHVVVSSDEDDDDDDDDDDDEDSRGWAPEAFV